MALDPITWGLLIFLSEYGASKVLDKGIQFPTSNDLRDKLTAECREWADEQSQGTDTLSPNSLLDDLFEGPQSDEEKSTARQEVAIKISQRITPPKALWHDALLEQWEAVRGRLPGDVRHPFFKRSRESAADELEKLAARLELVCAENQDLFRRTVYKSLNQLSGEVADEIEQRAFEQDLEKIRQSSKLVLASIRTDIGGIELPREKLLDDGIASVRSEKIVAIRGAPGVGKSVLLRRLAEQHPYESLVLSGSQIEDSSGGGWKGLGISGVSSSVKEGLIALSRDQPLRIYINDIHDVVGSARRKALSDLVRTAGEIEQFERAEPRISFIFAVRDQYLRRVYQWFPWREFGDMKELEVPSLTDEEIKQVREKISRLAPLLTNTNLKSITRIPFFLNLVEDERITPGADTEDSEFATEIELSDVWWKRVVLNGAEHGVARSQALMRIGEKAVEGPRTPHVADEENPSALHSLVQDRILEFDLNGDLYRFDHDIFEDWILRRVLRRTVEHNDNYLSDFLQDINQPFGLLRAMQLLGAALLEHGETEIWINCLKELEESNEVSKRWSQALLTGPLTSSKSPALLDSVENVLFENEASHLGDLMIALRTTEVRPNLTLASRAVAMDESQNDALAMAYAVPIPDWRTWVPFMRWLVSRFDKVPHSLRDETSRLMEMWQQHTPSGYMLREEVGRAALSWLNE